MRIKTQQIPQQNTKYLDLDVKGYLMGFSKIKEKHKANLYSDLHLLFSSGLDINSIFKIIISQYKKGRIKERLIDAQKDIVGGNSLAQSLKENKLANEFEFYALKIGEESGKLNDILKELKTYYEKKLKQKKQIRSALTYPILVLATAVIALGFMINVIVPMFEEVFTRFQGELPVLTKKLILFSALFKENFFLILLIILGIIILFKWLSTKLFFRSWIQKLQLKVPYLGNVLRVVHSSKFCHSMSLLISARAPLIHSLKMVRNMSSFIPLKETIQNAEERIIQGESLSESLRNTKFFDEKFLSLISAAEQVNQLEYAFTKLNAQYSSETEYKLQFIGNIAEPLLIIFVGGIVAIILIAMYMPLFQIGGSIY